MTELEQLHLTLDKAMAIERKMLEQLSLLQQLKYHCAQEIARSEAGGVLTQHDALVQIPKIIKAAHEKLSAAKGGE